MTFARFLSTPTNLRSSMVMILLIIMNLIIIIMYFVNKTTPVPPITTQLT